MVRTIIILIILSVCVFIGYNIQTLPAYVRIYNEATNTYIQTPFISWIIVSLVGAFVLLLVLKILWFIWRSPKIFSHSAQKRKEYKAHKLLKQGFSAMSAGDYKTAEKKLAKGGQLAEDVGQSSVIYFENAAIAADRQNANNRRDEYFKRARKNADRKDEKLTTITEAETLVANGEYTAALNMLKTLRDRDPKNVKVLSLLDQTYSHLEQWTDAWQNLTKLRSYMPEEAFEKRKKTYARGMLKDTTAVESYDQLQNAWRQLPAEIRSEKEMMLQYVSSLVDNGHSEEAEKILATQIKSRSEDLDLIQAYSQLRGISFGKALNNMKHWENNFPNNATFLYCKALIAYRAKEFSIASKAIETSLKIQPSAESYTLWGAILEASNQPEAALIAYHHGVAGQLNNAVSGEILPALTADIKDTEPTTLDKSSS